MTSFFSVSNAGIHTRVHTVLGSNIHAQPTDGQELLYLAAGCFWGVEKALWSQPGVLTTATGYMGGHTENPTYQQVCAHGTGHAETVRILFDTSSTSAHDLIRLFFEIHDPTQVGGQGNDLGDQYRSEIWTTTPAQLRTALHLREAYQGVLTGRGFGAITTRICEAPDPASPARFWYAEDYHQQYLHKNPGGYECHARTGVACPALPHEA